MRTIIACLLTAACACVATDEPGPAHGTWRLDTSANEGWFCVRGTFTCSPPAYFSPPPEELDVGSGGVLHWSNDVEQTGAVESACIRVEPGTEGGVPRTETTFCNLIDQGVVNETRAFAIIGWSPGTADECTCSAHFDLVD